MGMLKKLEVTVHISVTIGDFVTGKPVASWSSTEKDDAKGTPEGLCEAVNEIARRAVVRSDMHAAAMASYLREHDGA
jgi:hypothetical protein